MNNDLNKINLNQVESFEPSKYVRTLTSENGEQSFYMDVKYRVLWFRLKYPSGKIAKKLLKLDEKMSIVETRIYTDKNDPEDCFIASGIGQRYFSEDNIFGIRYVEMAETAAVGRALSNAGFGIQFCDSLEFGDNQLVDSGVEVPKDEKTQQTTTQTEPPNQPTQQEQNSQHITQNQQNQPTNPQSSTTQGQQGENPQTNERKPKYTENMAVDDITKLMALDDAKQIAITFGINKGKTLGQVAIEKPQNLEWFVKGYNGKNNILRAGAKMLIFAATKQQAC